MDDEEQKLKYMKEFRDQLVIFLDELIEQFPYEGDFVLIRIFIKDQLPIYDVIGRFIRDLLPLKKQVQKRDSEFFIQNTFLYTSASIGEDKINYFKNLWLSDKLDDTDRETIWKWMDLFISIADKYYKKFGYVQNWERT
jgi:hypothetical protein